jgi:hypothetical protein
MPTTRPSASASQVIRREDSRANHAANRSSKAGSSTSPSSSRVHSQRSRMMAGRSAFWARRITSSVTRSHHTCARSEPRPWPRPGLDPDLGDHDAMRPTRREASIRRTQEREGGAVPGPPVPLPGHVVAVTSACARFTVTVGKSGDSGCTAGYLSCDRLLAALERSNGAEMRCSAGRTVGVRAARLSSDVRVVCSIR